MRVHGAAPGDTLVVEVLAMEPAAVGWTAIAPGAGSCPRRISEAAPSDLGRVRRRVRADGRRPIAVPLACFPGVMGTALDEPGGHSTMPPRKNGGNMDIKHLTVGSTLYLPVWVDGALFSIGDGHGAQGDGEACVTAVEMAAT